ncbi:hypothetical protein RMCBS344292_18492 [Rhizopus microsporus]|nr:hypothetical protein RMCBS344292_18492 [Rhizopus microsporus]
MIDSFEKVIAEKQAKNLNNVLPPVVNEKNKGRPKGTKRRDILLERIEKNEAKKAKREALEEARKNKQHEKDMESLNIRIRPISVLDIKDSQKSKLTLVLHPIADGNCGFRCIAQAIYGDENLRMRVKQEMKEWFDLHKHGIYKDKMNIADVERILNNYDPAPPPDCWFDSLDCSQLAADVYSRSVAVYSETVGRSRCSIGI